MPRREDDDTYARIRAALKAEHEAERRMDGTVLIFGPGDAHGLAKRKRLARRLRTFGFKPAMSESISKKIPSSFSAYRQEKIHWRVFDLIIVLDFGPGPAGELLAYASFPDFIKHTFVVYPPTYDPLVGSSTYLSQVLLEYPFKERVTDEEWDRCDVIERCVRHALARRSVERSRNKPANVPPAAGI